MKITAFNNGQGQSSRPNFQSRAILVEDIACRVRIEPKDFGLAGQCLGDFRDGLRCVGILNKGVDYAEYPSDFKVAAGVRSSSEAQEMYQRVTALLDMAQKTDGEPIRVDGNFNILF